MVVIAALAACWCVASAITAVLLGRALRRAASHDVAPRNEVLLDLVAIEEELAAAGAADRDLRRAPSSSGAP